MGTIKYQDFVETSRIVRVAFAADKTPPPETKNRGESIDWDANASGQEASGWTPNDFEFSEEDFEYTPNESDPIVVWPPGREAPVAEINDRAGIQSVRFTSYEIGKKVLEWATNVFTVTGTTNVYEEQGSHTRRACIIEYSGIGFRYCPSVEIKTEPEQGGHRTLGKQSVVIKIFGTAEIRSGSQWHHYEPVE